MSQGEAMSEDEATEGGVVFEELSTVRGKIVDGGTWEDHFRETVFSIFSDPENGSILKHRPIWIIRKILCV